MAGSLWRLSRRGLACGATVTGLTISLLDLSDKVNQPKGNGLRKIVLRAEISPDGHWNLTR